MAAKHDEDLILTDDAAAAHLIDTWHDIGMGMVNAEYLFPWLRVRRGGGDYTAFISLFTGDMVTTLTDTDKADGIIEEVAERAAAEADTDTIELLTNAFEESSGGMYPSSDDGAFCVSYRTDSGYEKLKISLTTAEVWTEIE